ncbi:alpha/beta hydrolase family protein [Streptomyces sp. NPDC005047]
MPPLSLNALPCHLTLPIGTEPHRLPLVLLVHGGPWDRDSWGFNPLVQLLANRGYAVLQVNFRSSTGYGKSFMKAGIGELAGTMHDDLIDGVNWAIQEGYADPDRVAIVGGSYGGYAALVGVTFTPDIVDGASTQEAAARRLGLPCRVTDIMWRHEIDGTPLRRPGAHSGVTPGPSA